MVLVWLVAASPCFSSGGGGAARLPVPDEDQVRKAEASLKETFAGDLRNAKQLPEPVIAKLLGVGAQIDRSPATRYACFETALRVAVDAGDACLVIKTVSATAEQFEVDRLTRGMKALTSAKKSVRSLQGKRSLAEAHLKLARWAVEADEYDKAEAALKAALSSAAGVRDMWLTGAIRRRRQEASRLKKAYTSLESIRRQLGANANDPQANLALGRFYCFQKCQWVRGTAMLAKGSNKGLKAAAEKDLADPQVPEAALAAGDAWWDLAGEEEDKLARRAMRCRAAEWYEKVLGQLPGADREKYDKRIEESGLRYEGLPPLNRRAAAAVITRLRRDRALLFYASLDRQTIRTRQGTMYIKELSRHGRQCACEGMPLLADGKIGGALRFDGNSAKAVFKVALTDRPKAVSLMIWAKWDGAKTTRSCLLTIGLPMAIRFENSSWLVWFERSVTCKADLPQPKPGRWYHLAATCDKRNLRFYVNGRQRASQEVPNAVIGIPVVGIGDMWGQYFGGVLDEVYVFTRELTPNDIWTYYNATAGRPPKGR